MDYFEYCTLADFRRAKMKTENTLIDGSGDGALILDYIRSISGEINRLSAGREYAPRVATRYFDALTNVDGNYLMVDPFDLLAVTSITNGDGTSITAADYVFEPRYDPPYWAIKLKSSSSIAWTYSTAHENAITVVGMWGYHDNYNSAWETVTTLGTAITNTAATSATFTDAAGSPGDLLKIDSELIYLSARSGTTPTLVRGVNGSTAATHLISATVYRWIPMRPVRDLCLAAASIKYAIRENPQIESITVDSHVISVPKDVNAHIEREIDRLGLRRLV